MPSWRISRKLSGVQIFELIGCRPSSNSNILVLSATRQPTFPLKRRNLLQNYLQENSRHNKKVKDFGSHFKQGRKCRSI